LTVVVVVSRWMEKTAEEERQKPGHQKKIKIKIKINRSFFFFFTDI
jgi:hypothetical protein